MSLPSPTCSSQDEDSAHRACFSQDEFEGLLTRHEAFAARRPNGVRLILRNNDLSGLAMMRRNLSEANLINVRLRGCDLKGARLRGAHLYCADFTDADARKADFTRADLRGSCFSAARLGGARFDHADMRSASVARSHETRGLAPLTDRSAGGEAYEQSVDLTHASMVGVWLEGANLKGADMRGAVLEGAKLRGAKLEGALLQGAIMTGVSLEGLGLSADQIAGLVLDPSQEVFQQADLILDVLERAETWWTSGGAQGSPADLNGRDLRATPAAFANRRLTGLCAKLAMAAGVDFSGAMLQRAIFDGADLRRADFRGCDLRGASFRNANLYFARFDGADLRDLELYQGCALATDFTGALGAAA